MGHFLLAKILKVEVDKIYLYPLGGISKFFLPQNAKLKTELLILLAGPIFQILASTILYLIIPKYKELINIYHYGILIFNLLPIYPLDGGKLFNMVLSSFFPYKISLNISMYISYFVILILLLINLPILKINTLVMLVFLTYQVYIEQNKINIIYEKFILERYLNDYVFKNSKLIDSDNKFYKNNKHIINYNGKYFLEKEYLLKKYKKS